MSPRICLNMIVKNEAHVIERCLRSVRPFLHAWAIVDTGSTDGTQALIRRVLADLPGELIERPWVDFAHNRNQALELARGHGDYALLMDADDELFADTSVDIAQLDAAAYSVEFVHAETRFWRPLLVDLTRGWEWRGVLHEALYAAGNPETVPLPGLHVLERREGARSLRPQVEKYASDAEVLRRALEQEPDNTRYVFYLAQSLRDAGKIAEARANYQRRAAMGGWDEEVFYSKLQVAQLLQREGAGEAEFVAAYLDAHQCRPRRAEAMCALARFYRESERHALAYVFARAAEAIPQPDDLLFVDASVYAWRARDELSIAAYWCGERELSARLCNALLADPRLPAEQRERVRKNLAFATGA